MPSKIEDDDGVSGEPQGATETVAYDRTMGDPNRKYAREAAIDVPV